MATSAIFHISHVATLRCCTWLHLAPCRDEHQNGHSLQTDRRRAFLVDFCLRLGDWSFGAEGTHFGAKKCLPGPVMDTPHGFSLWGRERGQRECRTTNERIRGNATRRRLIFGCWSWKDGTLKGWHIRHTGKMSCALAAQMKAHHVLLSGGC